MRKQQKCCNYFAIHTAQAQYRVDERIGISTQCEPAACEFACGSGATHTEALMFACIMHIQIPHGVQLYTPDAKSQNVFAAQYSSSVCMLYVCVAKCT